MRRRSMSSSGEAAHPFLQTRGTDDSYWSAYPSQFGINTTDNLPCSVTFDFMFPVQDLSALKPSDSNLRAYGIATLGMNLAITSRIVTYALRKDTGPTDDFLRLSLGVPSSGTSDSVYVLMRPGARYRTTTKFEKTADGNLLLTHDTGDKSKSRSSSKAVFMGGTPTWFGGSGNGTTSVMNTTPAVVRVYGYDIEQDGRVMMSARPYSRILNGLKENGMYDSVHGLYMPGLNCDYGSDNEEIVGGGGRV